MGDRRSATGPNARHGSVRRFYDHRIILDRDTARFTTLRFVLFACGKFFQTDTNNTHRILNDEKSVLATKHSSKQEYHIEATTSIQ